MGKNRLWNKALLMSICFHLGIMPCMGLIFNNYLTPPLPKKPVELELVMSVAAQPLADGGSAQPAEKIHQPPQAEQKIVKDISPPVKSTPVQKRKNEPVPKEPAVVVDRVEKSIERSVEKNTGGDSEVSDKTPAGGSTTPAAAAGSSQNNSAGKGSGGQTGKSGGYIRPQLLNKVEPVYPERARSALREGTVLVSLEVLSNGRVGNVEIRRSSGHTDLDSAAVKAVRRWRFVPAKDSLSGQPITCLVNFPVVFQLK